MKKEYVKPTIIFEPLEDNCFSHHQSNYHKGDFIPDEPGCTCGCCTRDTPSKNEGCWGCPLCHHFNQCNHICY